MCNNILSNLHHDVVVAVVVDDDDDASYNDNLVVDEDEGVVASEACIGFTTLPLASIAELRDDTACIAMLGCVVMSASNRTDP